MFNIKHFNGHEHAPEFVPGQTDKVTLCLLQLSLGLAIRSQGVVVSFLVALQCIDEPDPLHLMFIEPLKPFSQRTRPAPHRYQVKLLVISHLIFNGGDDDDSCLLRLFGTQPQFSFSFRQWRSCGLRCLTL